MLDSLHIKNFRLLKDFQIERLGRINLIVGQNNSGKSSVLEALRIYAGNGQRELLDAISLEHDEKYRIKEGERAEADAALPFQDFFTGRYFPAEDDITIQIGSASTQDDTLRIQHVLLIEEQEPFVDATGDASIRIRRRILAKQDMSNDVGDVRQALQISKADKRYPPFYLDTALPRFRVGRVDSTSTIPCSVIPTQFISQDELSDDWDKISLIKQSADVVKQAMRIIAPEIEDLAFVRNEDSQPGTRSTLLRSGKVRLSGTPRPVPLSSLGDGMSRILQLALKLFPAKGGFLLIDEFENGLHFSTQEKVWALVFDMAEKLDIQVFATTHSWDCIESFAKVAIARKDIDGVLLRMGRSARKSNQGQVIATVFDEAALSTITQTQMEVR